MAALHNVTLLQTPDLHTQPQIEQPRSCDRAVEGNLIIYGSQVGSLYFQIASLDIYILEEGFLREYIRFIKFNRCG